MSDFIKPTAMPDLFRVERPTHEDDREFFREVFHLDELEEKVGFKLHFVQMNHSCSKKGVIRALHAENWNKLVYPVTGRMFAAVVDIRENSASFGQVLTFEFGASDRYALFVPAGFANSICVLGEEDVNYMYLVDKYYDGSDTRAIAWNDQDLAVKWPIENPIISERDQHNPTIRELFPEKFS